MGYNQRKIKTILIATTNKGKAHEIKDIFGNKYIHLKTLNDVQNVTAPIESKDSFIDNAILKACYYAKQINMPAIADDSGLCINALGGAPGVNSAIFANGDYQQAFTNIANKLIKHTDKSAHFACAAAIAWPNGNHKVFTGVLTGSILTPARGQNGFGYDPIFIPTSYNKTLAELGSVIKNQISHRKIALTKLITECFTHAQ